MINPIFPKTRYQGSKYKLREWIKEELNKLEFNSCLDAFSGTSSIAYLLKDMGKIVYTNDILNFNYYIAKALIENNNEKITQEEINKILIKKEDFIPYYVGKSNNILADYKILHKENESKYVNYYIEAMNWILPVEKFSYEKLYKEVLCK